MAQFVDTFTRADGPIGNNWDVGTYVVTIVSGLVGATSQARIAQTSLSSVTYLKCTTQIYWNSATTYHHGPSVKVSGAGDAGYYSYISVSAGVATFNLMAGMTYLNQTVLGALPPPYITLSVEWNQGHLRAWYGHGATTDLMWEGDDTTYAQNVYAGLYVNRRGDQTDVCTIITDEETSLSADPNVVGNYGACTDIELTGVGTSWTPGTPGSPTFTVNHGTISAQTVNSATSATITYCPGDYLGDVVITDPSTGEMVAIVVTSDPAIIPPPDAGERPSVVGAAILDRAGVDPPLAGIRVYTTNDVVRISPYPMDIVAALDFIVGYIYFIAGGPPPNGDTDNLTTILNELVGTYRSNTFVYEPVNPRPIKADTDYAAMALSELTQGGTINLASLGGSPTLYSHADIMTALGNIALGVDLQPVLDAIAALRGSQVLSLTDIAGLINLLTLNSSYNLGDILTAIANLNPATAPGLAAALATIMGSLGALALEIAAIGAAETEDAAASTAGAASAAAALAWLLANGPILTGLLNDIKDLLQPSGIVVPQPPVWPGLANVDLADPVDLASTNTLAGPMHGVLLDITSADPGTNRYVYDTMPAWKNIGALSFFTDTGHHETYQALSFASAIYVPKTMAVAGGVRVFHGRGPQGTITPWSFKT